MDKALRSHLGTLLSTEIRAVTPVSGGDIANAYLLGTSEHQFFCKTLNSSQASSLLYAEKLGLEQIAKTGLIKTPTIHLCDTLGTTAFLVMDYIEAKRPSSNDMRRFGRELANLHSLDSQYFGFAEDNFIGLLPQSNTKHHTWTSFYVEERLNPQLAMARSKGLLGPEEVPASEKIHEVLSYYCSDVMPGLLHGDLWGGNYLISKEGTPFLIDPASYYGHSEVDLAMSQLFGGFGNDFYSAYYELLPQKDGNAERMQLYQLYYLLVHLNLFGPSYYASVSNILKRFF